MRDDGNAVEERIPGSFLGLSRVLSGGRALWLVTLMLSERCDGMSGEWEHLCAILTRGGHYIAIIKAFWNLMMFFK